MKMANLDAVIGGAGDAANTMIEKTILAVTL